MDFEVKARKADREFNGAEYSTVRGERTSWPCAGLTEVYAFDDRPRRRGMGGALAQRQTVRV